MKGQTNIVGLTPVWRAGKRNDAFRVFVFKDGKNTAISAKIHPTLSEINFYLKSQRLKRAEAERDNRFQALKQKLFQELKSEFGLSIYHIEEKIALKTKEFNFEDSLEEFNSYLSDTGVAQTYCATVRRIWLPFFIQKGCRHPKDFRQWRRQAQDHVRSAKKAKRNEPYSIHTRNSLVTPLNRYLEFLSEYDYISATDVFSLSSKITLEQKKRISSQARPRETYTLRDLLSIKEKIDTTYKENLSRKLEAYALYFGLCTGLRRGNILGLKAKNLHPDAEVPYFETEDNIVDGWSRGQSGKVVIKKATKTFVGSVSLPMLMPSKDILIEVAGFLKSHLPADSYLIDRTPTGVSKLWKKIAAECKFPYLHPHGWKHSYATIGAEHLGTWFRGNPYVFQKCCMHEDFRTTQRYIDTRSENFLKAFKE